MNTNKIMNMTYTELENWWVDYKNGMSSWGGYLVQPYPELLTTWYAERVIDFGNLKNQESWTPWDSQMPASKLVIQAAKRHIRDLKRQGTDDFPWIFDEEKAHRPIRFLEKKCKPSKGDFGQIVAQPWQHFVIGGTYGWVHRDTGIRKYREALEFVGRKNGKTTMVSGLSNYMLGEDGENGANVYILANSQKQSNILFEEAKAMIEASPYLTKRFKAMAREIKFPAKKCSMVAMSAEKKKDGENLHFGCFDEVHDFIDYILINVMKRSRGMRKQPLIMYITTAGTVLDGPLMDFYENGIDCLEHLEDDLDERFFYFLAQLDDVSEADNPNMWIKANPNLCLMDVVNLVTDYKQDKKNPQEFADWITKQFNLFSDIDELSFVDIPTIEKNKKVYDLSKLKGKEAIAGYDLSETEDFTAAVIEIPLIESGEVVIICKSWISQARYDKDNNKQRLDAWIKQGSLEITPGDYVNYSYIEQWLEDQSKIYKIIKIRYDRRNSLVLNQQLESYGFSMEETIQGFMTLGGPMKHFKELLLDGKVIFNNSKMYRWYLSNVKLKKDRNSNWMPTKQSKNRKIDGIAATLNAHCSVVDMFAKPRGETKVTYYSVNDLMNM
ncbi:MAG: terminase large subunit [Streptococcaceae bacterium]|jgi:phage terminase large subunit-like protein|nr:terminase large subunit [Streptococcaceae bacterium]